MLLSNSSKVSDGGIEGGSARCAVPSLSLSETSSRVERLLWGVADEHWLRLNLFGEVLFDSPRGFFVCGPDEMISMSSS